ncbi:Cyclase/dehydrase [Nitrosotalea sinensis]|uniref:Cyclase/dehydrase n=1 Tax=Nitrosotalea sinensis TaxID=1499975 RepID=A0A2H1EGE4_9ARCH|nr:SRPBCC family protein [Candidatus Nitrosotalea sinensis]SHO44935.1 Cyclase/dehydrase [Candidatus Nitrosotalea sinensis]
MVEIKIWVQIGAPLEKVYGIISKTDDDPKFWTLTKRIRNISKKENEIVRESVIGKVDKCLQKITLVPNDRVHVLWTHGMIKGTRDIILNAMGNTTLLEISMDYKISGPAGLFSGRIKEELQMEAEYAADLIKETAEGRPHSIPMVERKSWADLIRG